MFTQQENNSTISSSARLVRKLNEQWLKEGVLKHDVYNYWQTKVKQLNRK